MAAFVYSATVLYVVEQDRNAFDREIKEPLEIFPMNI
jgi:hypothetical protein